MVSWDSGVTLHRYVLNALFCINSCIMPLGRVDAEDRGCRCQSVVDRDPSSGQSTERNGTQNLLASATS